MNNQPQTNQSINPGKGLGTASLATSLIGLNLISVIIGAIGLSKSKEAGFKNPMALAGIIIGSISFVILGTLAIIIIINIPKAMMVLSCSEDHSPAYCDTLDN